MPIAQDRPQEEEKFLARGQWLAVPTHSRWTRRFDQESNGQERRCVERGCCRLSVREERLFRGRRIFHEEAAGKVLAPARSRISLRSPARPPAGRRADQSLRVEIPDQQDA